MTVAAQKVAKQALALPKKERVKLLHLLRDSLPESGETLSQKEWNAAWKKELEKRLEEMESGAVKSIPYAQARKEWDKILGKA